MDIPRVMMCDGPHGLRKQVGAEDHLGLNDSVTAVCFPSASALAASFDREIMGRSGELDLQVEPYGKAILDEGEILMELKLPGVMPLWLGRILGELKIYPTSYSKYGTYYTRYVQPQREWGIEGLRESFAQRGQEWMIGGLACA